MPAETISVAVKISAVLGPSLIPRRRCRHTLFGRKMNTSPKAIGDRLERSHREATAIIQAEEKARREKTERLRAIRLAQEARAPMSRKKGSGKAKLQGV